jgi:hypothetical protein
MSTEHHKTQNEVVAKKGRRNMLKLAVFGAGAFVLGKLFSYIPDLLGEKVIHDIEFKNFSFVETNKSITISDKSGEALLVVDKDGI